MMTSAMKHSNKAAFTYIELIVVVLILGIFIGLSIPQFKKTFADLELDNFVKNIYLLCNYLQSNSIAQAKIYSLNFSGELKEFKSYFLKENGEWQILKQRFSRLYRLPEKITLETTPAKKNNVLFYPDGSSDNLTLIFKNEFGYERILLIGGSGEIKIQ